MINSVGMSGDFDCKVKLQFYFVSKIKSLKQPRSPLDETLFLLEQMAYLVNLRESNQELERQFEAFSMPRIKAEFKGGFYQICLKELLANLDVTKKSACEHVTLEAIRNLLIQVISKTNYSDSFNVLYDLCTGLRPGQHRDFCLYLLRQFLCKNLFNELIIENTRFNTKDLKSQSYTRQSLGDSQLIQKIINLPDKLANLYDPKTLNIYFTPNYYFKIISSNLWTSLSYFFNKLNEKSVSFENLSNSLSFELITSIYGKISLLGHSDILTSTFLTNLTASCSNTMEGANWRKMSQYFFESIQYKYLESCLLNLIRTANFYQDISLLIGDLPVTNSNFQYFLFDKLLFLKTIYKEEMIQNLIGYLCDSDSRRPLYYEVFRKLLNAWSTQTSIINTSYEQHLYLTKCILVCLAFSENKDKSILFQDLMKSLLKGVERHLHSPIDSLRTLGMIVGESLMNDLNDSNFGDMEEPPKRLKFEYPETEETKLLNSLKIKPVKSEGQREDKNSLNEPDLSKVESTEKTLFDNKKMDLKITVADEDSDDDLTPYDTSNDVPLSTLKQPAYLRDCLHALVYSEDPEKIEVSLKAVEKLCNTFHYELEEICVELLKVILHKSNQYSMDQFEEIRLNAMISITTHYPKESAQYLTSQFYDAGYSLTQRTDILHTLVISAQKLSNPNEDPIFDRRVFNLQNQNFSTLISLNQRLNTESFDRTKSPTEVVDWREVVKKRIAAKTVYKKQPSSRTTAIKQKQNVYSDTYGYFFFPLLKPYDIARVHLNIIEKDFMLLGKLIFSLSVIMFSSVNTSVLENMVTALLDFVWALRNHPEPFVRKSILFAVSLILIVIPDNQLLIGLTSYFTELKYWLETIIVNDANSECQKQAIDCMGLLGQRLKDKFNPRATE